MSEEIETIQQLFEKKSAWNKGSWATNGKKGQNYCEFDREQIQDNDDAVCFCLGGAITKVYGHHEDSIAAEGLVEAKLAGVIRALFPKRIRLSSYKNQSNETSVVNFNDHEDTTIAEIRRVVKIANV